MSRRSGIGVILHWVLSPFWVAGAIMVGVLYLTWYLIASPWYIYKAIRKENR